VNSLEYKVGTLSDDGSISWNTGNKPIIKVDDLETYACTNVGNKIVIAYIEEIDEDGEHWVLHNITGDFNPETNQIQWADQQQAREVFHAYDFVLRYNSMADKLILSFGSQEQRGEDDEWFDDGNVFNIMGKLNKDGTITWGDDIRFPYTATVPLMTTLNNSIIEYYEGYGAFDWSKSYSVGTIDVPPQPKKSNEVTVTLENKDTDGSAYFRFGSNVCNYPLEKGVTSAGVEIISGGKLNDDIASIEHGGTTSLKFKLTFSKNIPVTYVTVAAFPASGETICLQEYYANTLVFTKSGDKISAVFIKNVTWRSGQSWSRWSINGQNADNSKATWNSNEGGKFNLSYWPTDAGPTN
jgi:hypothetical protein